MQNTLEGSLVAVALSRGNLSFSKPTFQKVLTRKGLVLEFFCIIVNIGDDEALCATQVRDVTSVGSNT